MHHAQLQHSRWASNAWCDFQFLFSCGQTQFASQHMLSNGSCLLHTCLFKLEHASVCPLRLQTMKAPFWCLEHTAKTLLARCEHVERDLDVVELFAGVGSVLAAAQKAGLQSAALDKDDSAAGVEDMDICTPYGIEKAADTVGRLRVSGLLSWCVPQSARLLHFLIRPATSEEPTTSMKVL